MMSSTTRCGWNEATRSSASRPPCAAAVSKPSYRSAIVSSSVMLRSSSTTRMRVVSFIAVPSIPDSL